MPKLTTDPSSEGVVEGMIFSRLSPIGVLRTRIAPMPRTAIYVMSSAGAWTTPRIGWAEPYSLTSNSEMVIDQFRHIADEVHGAVDIAGAPVALHRGGTPPDGHSTGRLNGSSCISRWPRKSISL